MFPFLSLIRFDQIFFWKVTLSNFLPFTYLYKGVQVLIILTVFNSLHMCPLCTGFLVRYSLIIVLFLSVETMEKTISFLSWKHKRNRSFQHKKTEFMEPKPLLLWLMGFQWPTRCKGITYAYLWPEKWEKVSFHYAIKSFCASHEHVALKNNFHVSHHKLYPMALWLGFEM